MSDEFTFDAPDAPQDAPESPLRGASLLDDLRAEAKVQARREPLTLATPGRDDWNVTFDTTIEPGLVGMWRKRHTDKRQVDGIDAEGFACTVIASKASTILRGTTPVLDDEDQPITFSHPMMQELTGTTTALEAVRQWYGPSGNLLRVAGEVMKAAGYSDDLSDLDPSQRG